MHHAEAECPGLGMGQAGGRTWSMTKVPLREMPTWQKVHALRSTMHPCSSTSRSQSCNRAHVLSLCWVDLAIPATPDVVCSQAVSKDISKYV